jgi:hypothetical protein
MIEAPCVRAASMTRLSKAVTLIRLASAPSSAAAQRSMSETRSS